MVLDVDRFTFESFGQVQISREDVARIDRLRVSRITGVAIALVQRSRVGTIPHDALSPCRPELRRQLLVHTFGRD